LLGQLFGENLKSFCDFLFLGFSGERACSLSRLLFPTYNKPVPLCQGALRYRRWIPTVLAFLLAKQVAAAWLLWIWKPLGVEAPAKIGALAGLPVVALALWLSLRGRAAAEPR